MHVHIITCGETTEPILIGLNAVPSVDLAYIIASDQYIDSAETVKKAAENYGASAKILSVNGYSYEQVVSAIHQVRKETQEIAEEKGWTSKNDFEFTMNVTGGTKIMALAVCSTAALLNATVYYVTNDTTMPIKKRLITVMAPHPISLKSTEKKTIKILKFIESQNALGIPVTGNDIAEHFDMTKQAVSYHIKKLRDDDLINTENGVKIEDKIDMRSNRIELTSHGVFISMFMN